ncbi:hypothetical protein HTZ84_22210 [Haloterrigena sp. SYSU A558-1]|uniref:DUF7511 domain-containing protein n=1 Tax=Haloterrigena gelatinilytica TaxID=2741724 RepID=A0ABX2LGZ0_9EURY|nr:hypothetical protein [Haloterrigena gelatinilytica]NUC74981.1 hypothetical protein [Haloterrigena gelatinilytica]
MSTNTDDPFDYEHDIRSPYATRPDDVLEAHHIEHETAPDELAIFPASAGDEVTHQWMVATGAESFRDLENWR